jgi:hypothetical protein
VGWAEAKRVIKNLAKPDGWTWPSTTVNKKREELIDARTYARSITVSRCGRDSGFAAPDAFGGTARQFEDLALANDRAVFVSDPCPRRLAGSAIVHQWLAREIHHHRDHGYEPASQFNVLCLKHHQSLMPSIPLSQHRPFWESLNGTAVSGPRRVMQEDEAALVRQLRAQPVEYQAAIESVDEEHIESDRKQLVHPQKHVVFRTTNESDFRSVGSNCSGKYFVNPFR